jgi:hypothetical protein
LITLDGQQVIPALLPDRPGNGSLATHGIDGNQALTDIEQCQQFGMTVILLDSPAVITWPSTSLLAAA